MSSDLENIPWKRDVEKELPDFKKVCSPRCVTATQKRCECKCGGVHHGALHNENKSLDLFLTPEEASQFLNSIESLHCRWCRNKDKPSSLEGYPIQRYEHSGGWKVPGLPGRWWLYITCPECGYQWSLRALGVNP